jgi:hypothetical protein
MIHFIVAIIQSITKVKKEKPDYVIASMQILFNRYEWSLQF